MPTMPDWIPIPEQAYTLPWIIGLAVAALLPVLIYGFAHWFCVVLTKPPAGTEESRESSFPRIFFMAIRGGPLGVMFVAALISSVAPYLSSLWQTHLGDWGVDLERVSLLYLVAFTWAAIRFTGQATDHFANRALRDKGDEAGAARIASLRRVFELFVGFAGVLLGLQSLGVGLSGLLAFGGVGGIIVGFAVKDIFADILAGFSIHADSVFYKGDWIRSLDNQIEGVVESIGWRVTRIRTFDQRAVFIPNHVFAGMPLENPSRMHNRRFNEVIGLRYEDFSRLVPVIADMREYLQQHPGIDQNQLLTVHFDSYGDFSLNIRVYAFSRTIKIREYRVLRQEVLLELGRIIERHGASIAFPTSTVRLDRDGRELEEAGPPLRQEQPSTPEPTDSGGAPNA